MPTSSEQQSHLDPAPDTLPTTTTTTTLYLIHNPSPLFPAHWSLFLPNNTTDTPPHIGTRIHADGSPLTGFTLLIEPNYNLEECTQSWQMIALGEVDSEKIGLVERVAREVRVPGKTLVGVDSGEHTVKRMKVELRNCQTWVEEVVGRLVEERVVGDEAEKGVRMAPRN